MMKNFLYIFFIASIVGCSTVKPNISNKLDEIPASLLGNFRDDYGINYTINNRVWTQHPNIKYHLIEYNKDGQYFLAKNDDKNPSESGLFTRIDVMNFNGMKPYLWGFCLTAYNAKTLEEAASKLSADRNNPKKGCGGYPFSRMKAIIN